MFLLTKKVIIKIILLIIILILFSHCKQSKLDLANISDYKEFNMQATKSSCKKIRECFGYIYRTFPEQIARSSSLEECESVILKDLDKKIEKHNLKVQNLARTCYTNILSSDCKTLPLIIVTDSNCKLLKAEIKKFNISNY
jgi:hypothetical protein